MAIEAPLPAPPGPPSGLGTARPAFVHSAETGATSTPAIPTISPMQFGAAPNWAHQAGPQVQSDLLNKSRQEEVREF